MPIMTKAEKHRLEKEKQEKFLADSKINWAKNVFAQFERACKLDGVAVKIVGMKMVAHIKSVEFAFDIFKQEISFDDLDMLDEFTFTINQLEIRYRQEKETQMRYNAAWNKLTKEERELLGIGRNGY